jgi:uncharacterized protein
MNNKEETKRFRVPWQLAMWLVVNAGLLAFLLLNPSFFAMRIIYDFNTLIVPSALLVLGVIGIARWNRMPYERGILRASVFFLGMSLLLFGIRIYATHIEPYRLKLRTVTIRTNKVSRPLRILHVSDIQTSKVGVYEEKVFRLMHELSPDVVLCTGDFVQTRTVDAAKFEFEKLTKLINATNPPYGFWGVLGDVDWRLTESIVKRVRAGGLSPQEDPNYLESKISSKIIEDSASISSPANQLDFGVLRILENKSISIKTDSGVVNILGLSNPLSRDQAGARRIVSDWFNSIDTNSFSIVLGHSPDYVLGISELPIDLCLAGHTHGGQIRIPLFGPIITLSKVPRKLARGFHEVGRTWLDVSAGIGSEHADGIPPIRIHCPPEMTLIELVPNK